MGPPLKAAENVRASNHPAVRTQASMGPPLKAAENGRIAWRRAPADGGFNGAAAKSSGKYVTSLAACAGRSAASMGPPLKAAENGQQRHTDGLDLQTASMGPPLKAAENGLVASTGRSSRTSASMGPPLKAAENTRTLPPDQDMAAMLQWGRR